MKIESRDEKNINWINPFLTLYVFGCIVLFNSGWKYFIFSGGYFIIFCLFQFKIKKQSRKERIKNKIKKLKEKMKELD